MFDNKQDLNTLKNVIILEHMLLDSYVKDDKSGKVLGRQWLTVACDFNTRLIWGMETSLEYPSLEALKNGVLFNTAKKLGFTIINFGNDEIPKIITSEVTDEMQEIIIEYLKNLWTVKIISHKPSVERQLELLTSQELRRLKGTEPPMKMTTCRFTKLNSLMKQYTCNGVRLNYISYKSKELEPLLKGKTVKVYFDEKELSYVYIQNPISFELLKF